MCGICGIASQREPGSDFNIIVSAMNERLIHRGPDAHGQVALDFCAVAMRRLAIIDIVNGSQPMVTEDGRYTIVFNGEVYNFRELRQDLERAGVRFRTDSDTEVVLRLFRKMREQTPKMLKGMFAFCVCDTVEQSLFLARDRFGEKPLYYCETGGAFGFSSEIQSLLSWNAVSRQLDGTSLTCLLRFGLVPAPKTMFQHIKQLPPGCAVRWKEGVATVSRYYSPKNTPNPIFRDPGEAAEALRHSLLAAVKRQMISDVPIGALLSGGLDSSAVVAAMQMQSARPVKTFTMRFEHAPYDESGIARAVAHHLGTDHHEAVVANSCFSSDDLWRIVEHVGQPFVDSSAIPMYQITRVIREEVKVCLSGDGGDEMFAGYDYFRWVMATDLAARLLPRSILGLAGKFIGAARRLPTLQPDARSRQLQRGLEVASLPSSERIWSVGKMFTANEVSHLFTGRAADSESSEMAYEVSSNGSAPSRLRELMLHRLQYSLPLDMLVKVDSMSMANSLEVRAPLLDADLAQFSMALPDETLVRGGVGKKGVLRDAIRPWLPDEVFNHPKRGFSIPLHCYQNAAYKTLCRELLLDNKGSLFAAAFSRSAVERYVTEGLACEGALSAHASIYRASHQLWALLQVAAWMHCFSVTT